MHYVDQDVVVMYTLVTRKIFLLVLRFIEGLCRFLSDFEGFEGLSIWPF